MNENEERKREKIVSDELRKRKKKHGERKTVEDGHEVVLDR